jgi:hypothetical protein
MTPVLTSFLETTYSAWRENLKIELVRARRVEPTDRGHAGRHLSEINVRYRYALSVFD